MNEKVNQELVFMVLDMFPEDDDPLKWPEVAVEMNDHSEYVTFRMFGQYLCEVLAPRDEALLFEKGLRYGMRIARYRMEKEQLEKASQIG